MTDLRNDLFSKRAELVQAGRSAGVNPYSAAADTTVEPVRSDPYAALRRDTAEREANEFGLTSISSLSDRRIPGEQTERVSPPEPVLSEAVLVAAGLLEPEDIPSPDGPSSAGVTVEPTPELNEVSFSDFLTDGREPAEEPDLTEIFAGLDAVEPADAVWRRGDDDVIGAGTTPSRSTRRSLRLRRRKA